METAIDALTDEAAMDILNVRRTIAKIYDMVKDDPMMREQMEEITDEAWNLYSLVNRFANNYHLEKY
jgi:GrpB-like predicted nucleotidyltransferase (UPF0157 family)